MISHECFLLYVCLVGAVRAQTPQANVISDGKRNGLFLWITLKPDVELAPVVRAMARIQRLAQEACATPGCDATDDILAGVGFGSNLYSQINNSGGENRSYSLKYRRGELGELPNSNGDIFIHAKSNNFGKLFELTQIVQKALSPDVLAKYSDTYGFVFKEGRDLSGFVDGTENPPTNEKRNVALDRNGGSYCITQEWIHNMDFINQQKASTLESFVGRSINDSAELRNKSATSHVARMTSGEQFKATKPVQMYRQSMPYGRIGDYAGLFFIGFANQTSNFDYFLDRMVGGGDGKSDDIMRISNCISGNYWYFPSMEELERFTNINLNAKKFKTDSSPKVPKKDPRPSSEQQNSSTPRSGQRSIYSTTIVMQVLLASFVCSLKYGN